MQFGKAEERGARSGGRVEAPYRPASSAWAARSTARRLPIAHGPIRGLVTIVPARGRDDAVPDRIR